MPLAVEDGHETGRSARVSDGGRISAPGYLFGKRRRRHPSVTLAFEEELPSLPIVDVFPGGDDPLTSDECSVKNCPLKEAACE